MVGIAQQPGGGEQGLTIVEVMVAMVILLVGVLGTLVLIEGSLASTSRTTAREQGTNVARDLVERTRQAGYAELTMAAAPGTLRATLPASDAVTVVAPDVFTVRRRGVLYEVKVFACSIDDPTDGAGLGDDTFCAPPDDDDVPGVPAPGPGAAAPVNVLGIAVDLSGSALDIVCGAVGNPAILGQLTALVSTVAPVSVCPSGSGADTVQFDTHPDDLRRVRVDVTWTADGKPGSVSQTTLLTNPRQT